MAGRDTNFIFECWKYLLRVSKANLWEILSALEDKIRIPQATMYCSVYFIYTDEISKEPGACDEDMIF